MAKTYKLLEVKNLNTSFKITAGKVLAVNGVSFELDEGKVLGIVGESGSGKSVTAYSIMGILDKNGQVDSGKIIYRGTDLLKLSKKEMRDVRGNKISIIFQDAMTSLNPTWSIGNQLREAILVHAKDPVEQATYELANAVKSDKQRIASMKKGLSHHPDRQELKDDLAFVENKLIEDEKKYAEAHEKAIADYRQLKADKKREFHEGKPAYLKAINEAIKAHGKDYLKLNPCPSENEALATKEAREQYSKISDSKKMLGSLIADYEAFRDEVNAMDLATADPSVVKANREELKNKKAMVKDEEKRLANRIRKLAKIVRKYQKSVIYAPRNERRHEIWLKRKALSDFYWECKSAYKETKYSAGKKALQMLKEVGITEPEKRLKQYPFELSGGMLQRCMIAMALVQKPDILIADEPTTALDVTIQAQILELLKKLQKEYGMAILIITHDLGVVAQICDEVDIMYAGRIVERGTVQDIFYNPQHEYTKGLLNSMPKLNQNGKRLEPISGNPVDLFCLPKGCAFSSRCKSCMEICIDKYPEEVAYNDAGHAASCWNMIKRMHEEGKIDVVNGTPEGKPLVYNGAIIAQQKKKKTKKSKKNEEVKADEKEAK